MWCSTEYTRGFLAMAAANAHQFVAIASADANTSQSGSASDANQAGSDLPISAYQGHVLIVVTSLEYADHPKIANAVGRTVSRSGARSAHAASRSDQLGHGGYFKLCSRKIQSVAARGTSCRLRHDFANHSGRSQPAIRARSTLARSVPAANQKLHRCAPAAKNMARTRRFLGLVWDRRP